jgi:tRNA threonylcarbamoyladenosine biosynthesis protein TsaE
MQARMTWQTITNSSKETELLAEKLGAKLRGGEVIELVSDLGGGKTTFTRGLARGAGSTDRIASPTFTISREYRASKFTIAHFDFYRLGEAGIVGDELHELLDDPTYVTVIEWGDIVHSILPDRRLTIQINQAGEDTRQIKYIYPEELAYIMDDRT